MGWSLAGNQIEATCGSPTTTAPSLVCTKPTVPTPGSSNSLGVPWYVTTVVKPWPERIPWLGVTTSSPD